ncbi:hypothetical protein [Desulfomicrobium baculatum]|uniref:Carbohydrate-binding family V/XII n=1 Tax=Desulfomicrobium baculatum (strain DSM 4028 / VKM B-1378 / X) TaxID=525897 RepID=C7LQV8_DESBD|nr:hypothetical protein [Desulfomicrobium baculatum]ACU89187.1 conserved hypothetical protein [Desulfomicrobium baculatum DSM 4028]
MKAWRRFLLAVMLCAALSVTAAAASDDQGWPRVFQKDGKELTVYQPQVDFWQDYKVLHARFAIAVKTGAKKEEKYGVVETEAQTVVDQDARTVALIPKSRELRFPNTSDSEAAALKAVADELYPPGQALVVSLDRILAYLDPEKQPQQPPVELNYDPPRIFFSDEPAILVMFMGEPQLKPVAKDMPALMFAVNTNWDVFYDTTSQRYFLLDGDAWLTTGDLAQGAWTATSELPEGLTKLPADENWADVRAQVPGKTYQNPPRVFVSTEPAELVLTQGEPAFSPIPGTKLMRVANTDSDLFLSTPGNVYYLLVAGRWFRATSLDAAWTPASADLPADFALIPDSDPAAHVKSSVPGTVEAQDAILLASIPRATEVAVDQAPQSAAVYDGEPKFATIPSTTVQYAVNSPQQVFLVDGGYYWCSQGTWLTSSSPSGPWTFCTTVPAAIYSIPPSHPSHNVTYVTVQSSTPSTVVYTQTAGYSGEYVAATGVLMFGAGILVGALIADNWNDDHHYYYPPYPVPYSYGCGARYSYAYGGYYRGAAAYGPYGGAGAAARYNPATGTYSRGAYAYGPGGSVSARQAYNPYTGARGGALRVDTDYGSAGRGAAYNPSTGTAVRGGYRSNDQGTVGGIKTNRGTGAVGWDTENSQGAVVKGRGDNVYAGKDGTVYKRDDSGEWSSNSGSGWDSVDKPERASMSSQSAGESAGAKNRPAVSTTQTSQTKAASGQATKARPAQTAQTTQARPTQTASKPQPSATTRVAPRESTRSLESQASARQRGNQLTHQVGTQRQAGGAGRVQRR